MLKRLFIEAVLFFFIVIMLIFVSFLIMAIFNVRIR